MKASSNQFARRLPRSYRTIGSCYIFQQSPGAEIIGGLTVTVSPATEANGKIVVDNSLYNSNQTRDDIGAYQQEAVRGVESFSAENNLPLHNYHIRLSAFLVHDIDSRPAAFFIAAQSALKSALSAAAQKVL